MANGVYNSTATTGVNTLPPQSIDDKAAWNNFPIGTPHNSQAGLGDQLSRAEMDKYVIDIDAKRKEKFVKDLPITKLFEAMNPNGTVDHFTVTWAGLYKNTAQTESMPHGHLRTRDARGLNGAAWGTLTNGTTNGIPIPVANANEFGGKLQWQTVCLADDAGTANHSLLAIDGTIPNTSSVVFSSSALHDYTGTPVDGKVSGIKGEAKEISPILTTSNKHVIVYGMNRNVEDIKAPMDSYIRSWASLLNQLKYTVSNTTATVNFRDAGTGAAGGVTDRTDLTAFEFTYNEGTSHMVHPFFEMLGIKIEDNIDLAPNKIIGLKKFVYSSDLKSFYFVFDMFESNISFLKALPTATTVTATANIVTGAYYVVAEGTLESIGGAIYTPGMTFKHSGDTDIDGAATATALKVYPAWDSLLLEEVNTARYSTTEAVAVGEETRSHANRTFAPGYAGAPLGWTKHFTQVETTLDETVMAETADPNGSFDLSNVEGGSQNKEDDGRNFVEIFRSKVWMKTREEQLGKVRHGRNTQIDEERAMRDFYKGIEAKTLFGKLNFIKNSSSFSTPDQLFGAGTGSAIESLYTTSAGFSGEYKGAMGGLFDRETFPIPWARLPFNMGKPGFDPRKAADKGYALIEYCEMITRGMNRNMEDSKAYTVMIAPSAIAAMGLVYAKNVSVVSDTGNPFGTSIQFSPASDKHPDLQFDTFTYTSSNGITLTFVPNQRFDFTPKFKGSFAMLGKKYLDPKWLMIIMDKNNVRISKHSAYPDQEFVGLQPNHNVNIELRGSQASRVVEVDNVEDCLIIDMSPTESDVYLTN